MALSAQGTLNVPGGKLTMRGESNWLGRIYFSLFNLDCVSQPASDMRNAFLIYRADRDLRRTGWVRNITNRTIKASVRW